MTNNNALAIYDDGGFEVMQRSAKAMVASGFFKDANDVAKATVKVMAGAELGIAPFASMTGIHIISGKPTLSSNLIATLVKNDPRYNYQVKVSTDTICALVWFEGGNRTGESSFTIDEAKTAGLTRNPTWKSYPSDMLFARALTRGTRRFAPGVFGGAPVYTPDEMGANYDPVSDIVWEGKAEPTPIGIEPETGEIVDDAPQTAVEQPAQQASEYAPAPDDAPENYAEFLKWFADKNEYYTSNMHVGGAINKIYPNGNMGINFKNHDTGEIINKLIAYANDEAEL